MFWLGSGAPACLLSLCVVFVGSSCACVRCALRVRAYLEIRWAPVGEKQRRIVSKWAVVKEKKGKKRRENWKRWTFSTPICLPSFYCCCVVLVSVVAFLSFIFRHSAFPGSQTRRDKHTRTQRGDRLLQSLLIVSLSSLCLPFNLNLWPLVGYREPGRIEHHLPLGISHNDTLNAH